VAGISIGNDCLIGDFVSIMDCDFHDLDPATRRTGGGARSPITIGNNVWISTGATILKGVTIGDNSVVGARSVVTRSIPANSVAAGNPAKIVRHLGQASIPRPSLAADLS